MHEPDGATVARGAPARGRVRAERGLFLQLVGACGLVFARPILDAFGKSPETFVEAGLGWKAVVGFGIAWVIGPPLVLWALTFATGVFGPRVRRTAHVVVIGALAAVFTAQALVQAQTWPAAVVWLLAIAAALVVVGLWIRFAPTREFLAWLAGAPVVFLVLFLVTSPTADLLDGGGVAHAAATDARVPVVLVVLDELPTASLLDGTGHIDPVVFPNFARLAADGTWYRNHTTTGPTTERAVPAVLTGRYPPREPAAPIDARFPQNLFTLLGGDYTMHVSETVTALCPDSVCSGGPGADVGEVLQRSVDLWSDRFHRAQPGSETFFDPVAGGDTRGADFTAFTDAIAASPAARLDFAHLVLPHVPWELTPSGRTYDPGTDIGESPYFYQWAGDEAARFNRERHLVQLQYTDRLLGTLLDRLERLGTYDGSLVVVTADHGIAFSGDVPARATTRRSIMQTAYSPLFIKAPHQREGRIDDRNAESIDVVPTIADLIGIRLPWKVDGRSLAGPPRRSAQKYLVPNDQNRLPVDRAGRVVIDGDAGLRRLLTFSPASRGEDAYALFRGGPAGDLVGRAVADVPDGPDANAHAQLDPDTLVVDPPDAKLPIVVRATVDAPPDTVVALLVNGTVVGTYRPTGDHRARFVVPEAVLHAGRNDVALATVTGAPGAETLHPLPTG
jgi:hypothetical protein